MLSKYKRVGILLGIVLGSLLTISYFHVVQKPPRNGVDLAVDTAQGTQPLLAQYPHRASSCYQEYYPTNLSDTDPETFWHVAEVRKPAWVIIDFGTSSGDVINSFQALPRKGAPSNFWRQAVLQGSNNARFWTNLADVSVDKEPVSAEWLTWHFDAQRRYRYYRLFITPEFTAFAEWQFNHCDLSEIADTGSIIQTPGDSLLNVLRATPGPIAQGVIAVGLLAMFGLMGWRIVLLRNEIKGFAVRFTDSVWSAVPFESMLSAVRPRVVDHLNWLTMGTWAQKNYRREVFTLSLLFLCYLIPKGLLLAHGNTFKHDAILHYATYHYFMESLWNGYWPFWNPYMHGGEPFYHYWGYFCALDPTILGCAVLSYFDLSIYYLYHWNYIFRTLVIILGLYLVFRRLLKNVLSTYVVLIVLLFGALTSDFYICHHRLDAFRWFPWAFYFLLRLLDGGGAVNLLCIAYFMGVNMGSSVYHWPFAAFVFTLFLVTLGINHRDSLRQVWSRLIARWYITFLSVLIFLGLCLPNLAPVADMQKFFYLGRDPFRDATFVKTAFLGIGKGVVSVHLEALGNITRLFLPTVKHVTVGTDRQGDFLIGIVPAIFFLLGILVGRGRLKVNFAITLIVIALLMVGVNTFFPWLMYPLFPPLNLVSSLTWFEPFLVFCVAFFIGLGVDFVMSSIKANEHDEGTDERYKKVYCAVRDLFLYKLQLIPDKASFITIFCALSFILLNRSYLIGIGYVRGGGFPLAATIHYHYWEAVLLLLGTALTTYFLYRIRQFIYERSRAYLFVFSLLFLVIVFKLSGWKFFLAIYIALAIGILLHKIYDKLGISTSMVFPLWILLAVFVELIMIAGDYHSCFFVQKWGYFPKQMFETHRQDPVFPAKRQPTLKAEHGPIGPRWRNLVFKVNTAIEETLNPRGVYNATTNPFEEAYHNGAVNQMHPMWLKAYLQAYEIGEQSIPKFEALMGIGKERSMLEFYRYAIVMDSDETNTLFLQLPYEELWPILKSAVFIDKPLEEQFKWIEKDMNSIDTSRKSPHFDYEVIKYNPNHIEIDVEVDEDGILHFLDGYDNYWEVYVDGKRQKMYSSNILFKAVAIEKGRHRVVFNYNPVYFLWGLRAYLTANFVFIASVFFLLVWKQRGKPAK